MASDDEEESREPFPAINTKESELEVGWDYKLSKTTPSFILPPTRVHNLPKQHHQLGSSIQILNPYSKHHSMSVCIWASSYIRYVCVYMYKPIYVCLGICLYMCTYIFVYVLCESIYECVYVPCVCVFLYIWFSACMCVLMYVSVCLFTCT